MTKKQWTAVLKNGTSINIETATKEDIDEIWPIYEDFLIEVNNPYRIKLVLETYFKREACIFLKAELNGEIIGFILGSYLKNDKLYEIVGSLTKKGHRGEGVNSCLRLLLIRLIPEKIKQAYIDIFSEKLESLMKKYEDLEKEIKIKITTKKRQEDFDEGKLKKGMIIFEKTKKSDELIEKLLKKRYTLEFK